MASGESVDEQAALTGLRVNYLDGMTASELLDAFISKLLERLETLIDQNEPFSIILPLNGAAIIAIDLLDRAPTRYKGSIKDSLTFVTKSQPGVHGLEGGKLIMIVDEIVDTGNTVNLLHAAWNTSPSDIEIWAITRKHETNAVLQAWVAKGIKVTHIPACFPNIDGYAQWITSGAGLNQGSYPDSGFEPGIICLLERLCTQFFGRSPRDAIQDWSKYLELLRANIRPEYKETLLALEQGGPETLPNTREGNIARQLYFMERTGDYDTKARCMRLCLNFVLGEGGEA